MLTSMWRKFLTTGQPSAQRSSPIRRKQPGFRSFRLELELLEERCLLSAVVITDFTTPTAKSGPAVVTVGPDGNLWFTESGANKIGMINPTTHAISEFSIPTANSDPEGITAGPDGNVWFAEYAGNQIGMINVATHVISEYNLPTMNAAPYAITVGRDGNLWFTELSANQIGVINPSTHSISEFLIPTPKSHAAEITAGPDGNLWFTEASANQIGVINPSSYAISEIPIPTPMSFPSGITAAGNALWFTEADANQIGTIDPKTHAISEFTIPTGNSSPEGITAGPDRNLWFTELSGNQIGTINLATDAVSEFAIPTGLSVPFGITVGPDGNLWFTEENSSKIGEASIVSNLSALVGNNQSATVGAVFGTRLEAQVVDDFGNPVKGAVVSFSEANGYTGAGGTLNGYNLGQSAAATTNAQGLAFAPMFTANDVAGAFTVTARLDAPGDSVVTTFNLTNLPGAPASLVTVGGTPQSTPAGAAYFSRLQADVTDIFGNPIANVPVAFVAPGMGASGSFNAYATVPTNALGIATAPAFTANQVQGSFHVSAAVVGSPLASVTFTLTNTAIPGVPANFSAAGGSPQNTPVATKYANPLQTLVTDGFGSPVANVPVTFTAPNVGASGSFKTLATVLTNGLGIATAPAFTANQVQGSFVVTATVATAGIAPVVFNLTNTALPAAIAVVTGTTPQSAVVGQAYATTLKAKVTDAAGKPVVGITVVFALPNGKPAGTFANFAGSASAVTDATGVATAPVLTANTSVGQFTVVASVVKVAATVSFKLTNTVGSAAIVSAPGVSGGIENAVVAKAYAPALQALVTDAFGNPVAGITVTFTAPAGGAGIVTGTFVGKTAGTTTNVVTAVSAATGLATAPAFTANTLAGNFSVTATIAVPGSPPANIALTNVAGPATKIAANSGTLQTATVNQTFATPLQALVTDAFGNPVRNATVMFTATALAGGASGLFANGTRTATVLTNAAGIAQAPTFTANGIAASFVVTAATTGVTATTSFSLTNAPIGPVAKIAAAAGTPQTAIDGSVYATPLQVLITDANNNPISGVTVTFAASAVAGGASGNFAGSLTITALTGMNGIAQAPAFTANTQVGAFVVTASVSGLTPTASFSLTNLVGPVAKIVAAAGTPQTTTVGSGYATPFQALVTDANNNPISGIAVTFTAPGAGAGGTFAGGNGSAVMALTNTAGIAQTPSFIANGQTGKFVVTAAAGNLAPISFSLTNGPAQPNSIFASAGSTPQMAGINTSYGTPLQAEVLDVNGNPIVGIAVVFTAPASGASGTFPGGGLTAMATTNIAGVAQAPTFTANATGGSFIVTASVSGVVSSASFNLANTGGTAQPFKIVPTAGTPQMAIVSTSYSTPLQVIVTDANGNPVNGVAVLFTAQASGASGASGTFAGGNSTIGAGSPSGGSSTAMATTNIAGVAQAPTFTANATGGSFVVTASVSGLFQTASFSLTNTNPPANIGVTGGDMQTAAVGTTYGTLLQVKVTDSANTPLSNVIVTFTAPASGPSSASGTFADTGTATTTATTDSMGFAQAPAFTANELAGGVAVTASVNSLTATFQLTNTNAAPQPASIVVTGGNKQTAMVNTDYASPLQVTVTDLTGKPVSNVTVTFSAPTKNASGTFSSIAANDPSTATAITNSLGIAQAPTFTANGTAGTFPIFASVNSLTTSFTLTNGTAAGSTASIQVTAGDAQSASPKTAFGMPLQVQVLDANANPITKGTVVTFTVLSVAGGGAGGFFPSGPSEMAPTDSNGFASVSDLMANGTTGVFEVQASFFDTMSSTLVSVLFTLTIA